MLSDKCVLCFEVGNEKNDDGICAQCSKILNELGYMKKVNEDAEEDDVITYCGQKIEVWNKGGESLADVGVNYAVLNEAINYMKHLQKTVDAGGYEKTLSLIEVVQDLNNAAVKCYLTLNQESNCYKDWVDAKDILFDLEYRTNPKYLEKHYELLARNGNGGKCSDITIDISVIEVETELHGNYL